MRHLVSFVAGLLFAIGLGISGMTLPTKVVGFLDVTGAWDPSLALVMVGAIGVNLVPSLLVRRRSAPVLDTKYHFAAFKQVDAPLVIGAALFGLGWGLGGYCPGPAVVASAGGMLQAFVFTLAMMVGFGVYDSVAAAVRKAREERAAAALADG